MRQDAGDHIRDDGHLDGKVLKVTKEASRSLVFRLVGAVLGFATNMVLARLLGAERLGVFVLGSTVLIVASLLTTFGMRFTFLRFIPVHVARGEPQAAAGVFRFGLRVTVLLGVVGSGVILLGGNVIADGIFNEPQLRLLLPIVAAGVIPATLHRLLGNTLRALKRTGAEAMCVEIINKVVKLAMIGALVLLGMKLRAPMIAVAAAFLVSAAAMFRIAAREAPYLATGPERLDVSRRELVLFSGTMFFMAVMNYGMSITDRIMLGILSTSDQVGIYNIAFLISNLLTLTFMGFNAAFAPFISELYHDGRRQQLAAMYQSLTRIVLLIVLPSYIWLVGFGDDVLRVFGGEFREGYISLLVLGAGVLARCVVGSVATLLVLSGRQRVNVINVVVLSAVGIALNLLLIPRYGQLGAAIGTAISLAGINLAGLIEVRTLMGLWPYNRSYLKLLAAGGAVLLGCLWMRSLTPALSSFQALITLALVFGAFAGLMLLFGIESDDRMIIGRLLERVGLAKHIER